MKKLTFSIVSVSVLTNVVNLPEPPTFCLLSEVITIDFRNNKLTKLYFTSKPARITKE